MTKYQTPQNGMTTKYGALYRLQAILWFLWTVIAESSQNALENLGLRKYRKYARLPESLAGRTVLVTGANTGIGKETVRAVVERDGKVIMACRDVDRAEAAKEDLVRDLGEDKRKLLSVVQVKLDDLKSVRNAAKQINSQVLSLDVLINNAGVMACPELTTADGFEYQFGTNHLGHFLFTHLLLEKLLAASSPARIVNVSSIAYMPGKIDYDNLNMKGIYNPNDAYSRSKFANILFTRELSRRLRNSGIHVYAVHPGMVRTELMRHFSSTALKVNSLVDNTLMIGPVEGAQTSLYCAFDPAVANQTGFYYSNCGRDDSLLEHATDDEDAVRLWDLSLKLTNIPDCKI